MSCRLRQAERFRLGRSGILRGRCPSLSWRAHAVSAWTAIAVAAAVIANIVGLSAGSVPITIASFALLLTAFGRIAVIVRSSPAWAQPDTPVTTRPPANALPARS